MSWSISSMIHCSPFFWNCRRVELQMAVSIAEQVDREIEKLATESIEAINTLGDRHALNRSMHRKMHLDEIEKLLQASRFKTLN